MNEPRVRIAVVLLAASVAIAASPAVVPADTRAQARLRAFDPALLETGDLIRYRPLEREDFRALDPPAEAVGLHTQLGAATCVFIATDPDMYIRSSSRGLDLEVGRFRTRVENLGFLAFMDRGCSWWNPAPLLLPDNYILQHEQIHFALFEIAARELNGRAADLAREMETVTSDQEQAVELIQRRLDVELQRAVGAVVERSNRFDNDTSLTYRPDQQSWWWNTVSVELERLRRSARSGG